MTTRTSLRPRARLTVFAALAAAAAFTASDAARAPSARAADAPVRRLPFCDDVPPPPPLPEPLDRRFHGEMTSFDGDRVGFRWGWKDDAEVEDFEAFVPIRVTVRGGFERRADGILSASGTAGLRLRLGMLADLTVKVDAVLDDPHDCGVVLVKPGTSDESIVCHVQDRLFTRFDAAAGNTNMINKLGGIPATAPGMVEFRYVARNLLPKLEKAAPVRLDVLRKGPETTFTITPKGETGTVLKGKDTDTPMTRFQAGLYVASSTATWGPLEIEGAIDRDWCKENDVLPYVAGNLLHPGNRFKGAEKKAAENVETYVKQAEANEPPDPKVAVPAETLGKYVGDAKLPLVIRIRAAEALADAGAAGGSVGANIAKLLDGPEAEARVLAWRVLRPRLPWDFHYEPDAEPSVRREAALLVANYFREEGDALAQGKVFVEGYWYTPSRADQIRGVWEKAWDLRTPHVRLKTNLSKEWADWTLNALEAGYREMTRVAGSEPPAEKLPLSILVFAADDDFRTFCGENGYDAMSTWRRFADLDRLVAFDTFERRSAPLGALHLLEKVYTRAITGISWPSWFEEGRAAWFASPEYGSAKWDGATLQVGLLSHSTAASLLSAAVSQDRLWSIEDFLNKDPRTIPAADRRLWYAYAWGLHTYLIDAAPEEDRTRFADWQSAIQALAVPQREVESLGRRTFLAIYARDAAAFEGRFRAWLKSL